jgi:hypothetical protein
MREFAREPKLIGFADHCGDQGASHPRPRMPHLERLQWHQIQSIAAPVALIWRYFCPACGRICAVLLNRLRDVRGGSHLQRDAPHELGGNLSPAFRAAGPPPDQRTVLQPA